MHVDIKDGQYNHKVILTSLLKTVYYAHAASKGIYTCFYTTCITGVSYAALLHNSPRPSKHSVLGLACESTLSSVFVLAHHVVCIVL